MQLLQAGVRRASDARSRPRKVVVPIVCLREAEVAAELPASAQARDAMRRGVSGGMTEQPRDAYQDCCRAGRAAIARAIERQCTRKQLRALMAVIAFTAMYSRLRDEVYVNDLAEFANLHIVDARRALRELAKLEVIEYVGRRNARSTVGLVAVSQLRGDSAHVRDRLRGDTAHGLRGEDAAVLRGDPAHGLRGGRASVTEKSSEKVSEWVANVGVHYAHDRDAFAEEACGALKIDATAAETLRLSVTGEA